MPWAGSTEAGMPSRSSHARLPLAISQRLLLLPWVTQLLSTPLLSRTGCVKVNQRSFSLVLTALEHSWHWFSSCYVSKRMSNMGAVPSLPAWMGTKVDSPGARKFKACCWPLSPQQQHFVELSLFINSEGISPHH